MHKPKNKHKKNGTEGKTVSKWVAAICPILVLTATPETLLAHQQQIPIDTASFPMQELEWPETLKDQSSFFQSKTEINENGEPIYTFQFTKNSTHSSETLDDPSIISCEELVDSLDRIIPAESETAQYQCIESSTPWQGTIFTMSQKEGMWKINDMNWYNGCINLHVKFDREAAIAQTQLSQLWQILESTRQDAGQKGAEPYFTNLTLTFDLWQWLVKNHKSLANTALASWHGYEVLSHSLHIIHNIETGGWPGLVFDTFSTLFHMLEGLEHIHHAGLGQYVHTDFHGDIIAASRYPHATNIGLASAALSLNIVGQLYHTSHNHEHESSQLLTLMSRLHSGLHIYELGHAINDWWQGHPAHEHAH